MPGGNFQEWLCVAARLNRCPRRMRLDDYRGLDSRNFNKELAE
jgi:hypothetical protein